MHYGSQPSLLRSAGQRDSKYQHPHARYSGGQVGICCVIQNVASDYTQINPDPT